MCCLHVDAFIHLTFHCEFKSIVYVLLERRVPLRLNYSKYGGLLTEDNLIHLAALLLDYNTNEKILAVRNIVLVNPQINVKVSKKIKFSLDVCVFYGWVLQC